MKTIEASAIPSLLLKVDGKDYTVTYPLSAVAQLEEQLQRPLRTPQGWLGLPAKDLPAVLAAGLSKHNDADTARTVAAAVSEGLNPEGLCEVLYALAKLAFPKVMEDIEQRTKSPNA
jgi:hypothetical protein